MSEAVCRIVCPGDDHPDAQVRAIRARGNFPLLIGERLLAEIGRDDLAESWATTLKLPAAKAARLARLAKSRLAELLDEHLDSDDIVEVVSGAAVILLTAMREAGEADPARLAPDVLIDAGPSSPALAEEND
jgi:hypothetical protein